LENLFPIRLSSEEQPVFISHEVDLRSSGKKESIVNLPWPHDLIDREIQHEELIGALDRSRTKKFAELTLITGSSGSGKSSLALKFKNRVLGESAYFVSGEFDQFQSLPYHPLVQAITDFVAQVTKKGEDQVANMKLRSSAHLATTSQHAKGTGTVQAAQKDFSPRTRIRSAVESFVSPGC
jgi:energy-coupling factor transporter ATP-binding protein EcfA2